MFKKLFFCALTVVLIIFAAHDINAEGGGEMKIQSSGFKYNETLPVKFTCDAEDISPQLSFENVPVGTKSLALMVYDPDAPSGNFVHWLVYNIPPDTKEIPEGGPLPKGSVEAVTDFGRAGYGGPCPPQGKAHRYVFKVYALDISGVSDITKTNFAEKIKNHTIVTAEIVGLYKR